MAISINHATRVVTIPKADTTFIETNAATGYEVRSYDEYALMRALADYLDSEAGAILPKAFDHNSNVTISGVTYARAVTFLAPYTFTFENGSYQVKLVGGTNNNLLDVLNPNNVSVIPANSAGLQTVATGGGTAPTAEENADAVWAHASAVQTITRLAEAWARLGLDASKPVTQSTTEITFGDLVLALTESSGAVTVQRQ